MSWHELARRRSQTTTSILLLDHGCGSPERVFEELRVAGFFSPRPPGVAVTTKGHRTLLFTCGALGTASNKIFDELRQLEATISLEKAREGDKRLNGYQ